MADDKQPERSAWRPRSNCSSPAMAKTPMWLSIFTALLACTDQVGSVRQTCSPDTFNILTEVKDAAEICGTSLLSTWSHKDKAQLLGSMATLSQMIKKDLLKACLLPDGTPSAEVPGNGGIVCVTIEGKVYCKPMCNHGYDFSFLRRSRPYEVCAAGSWTTQFIGGNRLASCSESAVQISAGPAAYFPERRDCQQSLALHREIIKQFISELSGQQVTGTPFNGTMACKAGQWVQSGEPV